MIGVPDEQKATCVTVRPDGALLAVGTANGRVLLGDLHDGQPRAALRRSGHVCRVIWTGDGDRLLVGDRSGTVGLYDGDGDRAQWELETGHGSLRDMALFPEGRRLATCGSDGMLRVWDLQNLALLWENGRPGSASYNAVGVCGDQVAVGSSSGSFIVFNGPGEAGGLLNGGLFPWGVSALAIHPGGEAAVFGGDRGGMQATSTERERLWPKLHGWPGTPPKPICVNTMQFSPDGGRFVAACSDGAARVFQWCDDPSPVGLELGNPFWLRRPKPMWTEAFIVSSACFDPSGGVVYTCSFDGSVRRWDLEGERPLASTLLLDLTTPTPAGEEPEQEGLHWRWCLLPPKPLEPLVLPRWSLALPSLQPRISMHVVEQEHELPMVLLVLGDFICREDPRLLDERVELRVDRDSFQRVMAQLEPRVSVTVGRAAESTELVFDELCAFDPLNVVAALEARHGAGNPEVLRAAAGLFRDPEFARLESAWRGLWMLVQDHDPAENVRIEVINCNKEDLYVDFEDSPELVRCGLADWMLSTKYYSSGGRPYAAVISDFTFGDSRRDQTMMAACAGIAELAAAPFFAAAAPGLLALTDPAELATCCDLRARASRVELGRPGARDPFVFGVAGSFAELRRRTAGAHVGLCLPRVVTRPPVWLGQEGLLPPALASAAFAVGAELVRSFVRYRTCSYFDEPPKSPPGAAQRGVTGLGVEVALDEARALELSRLGFIPLVPADGGRVRVASTMSCYRPPDLEEGDSRELAHATRRHLGCTFIAARLLQQLCLLAGGCPDLAPAELAPLLDGWLQELVDALNRDTPSSEFNPPFEATLLQRPEAPRHPVQLRVALPASHRTSRLEAALDAELRIYY